MISHNCYDTFESYSSAVDSTHLVAAELDALDREATPTISSLLPRRHFPVLLVIEVLV